MSRQTIKQKRTEKQQKQNLEISAPMIATEIFKNSPNTMAIKIHIVTKRVDDKHILCFDIETYTKDQLNLISETGMYYIRKD